MSSRGGVSACRSLARAGYRVIAAHVDPQVALRTRHAERAVLCPSPTDEPARFVSWVRQTCAREGVLAVLPLDEESVKVLLDVHLEGTAVSGPTAAQYAQLGDKAGLAATALAAGVDHPESVVVDCDGPKGDWPQLPSVIKPTLSEPGSRGGEIVIVETVAERERVIARMVAAVGTVLVQELVKGQGWRVHFVRAPLGLAAVCGRTVRRWPARTGMSSMTTFEAPYLPALEAAGKVLDVADYRGCGSVQFIESEGRLFVHDVNLRPLTTTGGSMAAGLDLPRLAVEVALGRPTLAPVDSRTIRYVWLSAEIRALALALVRAPGTDRPGPIARDLAYAAIHPRGVLDPFDVRDPLPLIGAIVEVGQWAVGLGRRRLSGCRNPTRRVVASRKS